MKIFKKILKWGGITIGLLALVIFVWSEAIIFYGPEPTPVALDIPTDEISIEEGRHLAQTRGCMGCHNPDLAGQIFFEDPIFARVVTPNLTKMVNSHSVEVFEAAVRQGIGTDGEPLVLMPSDMYSYLTDEDLGKILAFMRTVPEVEDDLPENYFGPMARGIFILGEFKTAPEYLKEAPPRTYNSESHPDLAAGEYLARTMCSECHGLDLRGDDFGDAPPPDLMIASAYTLEEFRKLMSTGLPPGERDLGLMKLVSETRFSYMTDLEMENLHKFLLAYAEARLAEEGAE